MCPFQAELHVKAESNQGKLSQLSSRMLKYCRMSLEKKESEKNKHSGWTPQEQIIKVNIERILSYSIYKVHELE